MTERLLESSKYQGVVDAGCRDVGVRGCAAREGGTVSEALATIAVLVASLTAALLPS
jgi:hypothetical protein